MNEEEIKTWLIVGIILFMALVGINATILGLVLMILSKLPTP